tara:strand:- start:484 stop:951 length:468 start_codon:yes stop_codon:yes gene_type:complete
MSMIGNAPSSGQHVVLDAIVTNGNAGYTLQKGGSAVTEYNQNQLIVSVNGTIQAPGSSFTVTGSTITFASALTNGTHTIDFILALGNVHNVATVGDTSITPAKLATSLGITNTPVRINTNTISESFTLGSNQNAMVAGPVNITGDLIINGTFTVV